MRGLGLVLVIALASPVRAQNESMEERARRLSDEGLADFNQGRYREAVRAFEESFELRPLPLLLFNVAQAHRLAGDCALARDAYRRYVDENPRAGNRKLAEAFLLDMEKCASAAPPVAAPNTEPRTNAAPINAEPAQKPAPASVFATESAPPPRKPIYRQWWLWTTVGVVVAGVALGLGVGLSQTNPPSASLGTITWH